jgi:hypothetical protein
VSQASVELNNTFLNSDPDVCIFLHVVFIQILIKIVQLYIIPLHVSKLPCGTHINSH